MEKGIITRVGYRKGYGKSIEIQHRNNVRTIYAHLEQILVKTKDRVRRQQVIGIMGNTGRSSGTHLHFEVIVNKITTKISMPLRVIKPVLHRFITLNGLIFLLLTITSKCKCVPEERPVFPIVPITCCLLTLSFVLTKICSKWA